MKKTLALSLITASALATGCIQESDTVSHALPLAEDIKVDLPENGGPETYALGQIADYYRLTRGITREFNTGVGFVLVLVHTIVQFPATSAEGTTYTWGPHSDALDPAEWRLVVTDNLDGTYDWAIDGRSKTEAGSEFLNLVTGFAVEGARPHRGSGEFTMNFDNARLVNPIDNAQERGQVTVAYDLENTDGTQASLDLHIDTSDKITNEPIIADYHYAANADGSGDFQFNVQTDIDNNASALESVILRSRWTATGEGRGDARLSAGDLLETVVEASECWDSTFRRVYYTDSVSYLPTEGDVANCAFADQDLPDA